MECLAELDEAFTCFQGPETAQDLRCQAADRNPVSLCLKTFELVLAQDKLKHDTGEWQEMAQVLHRGGTC